MWLKCTFLLLLFNFVTNKASNILVLLGVASPSNQLWSQVLIDALAERGHNMTILSVDLPKYQNKTHKLKNLHYLHLENVYNTLANSTSNENSDVTDFIGLSPINQIFMYYDFGIQISKIMIKSNGFKTLLNYPDNFKFDLVLYDFTVGGFLLGFVHKFKYPSIIGLSPFHLSPITQDLVGGHFYPAYIPMYSLTYDMYMNFWQRLYNTFLYTFDTIYRRMYVTPLLNEIIHKEFGKDMKHIRDIEKHTVLTFVNSHSAVNYPHVLPPNIIEIGGMQIKNPNSLEQNLENFIQNSYKGAIFFSLGTNFQPQYVDLQKINAILETIEYFSDYNFLWKFNANYIKRKIPENLLIREFFPQRDILAHPNLKLFITHAGGLSTQEATWRGVPMIGIPLFLDQHRNLHKSILAGVAVKVDYSTLTATTLKNAIKEILKNKTYSENMKLRSLRFRDRPMTPLDTAVWWTEYVIRNPNPQHLKSPVLDLGFFVSNGFDVLAFVFISGIALLWIIIKILIIFYSKIMQQFTNSSRNTLNKIKTN